MQSTQCESCHNEFDASLKYCPYCEHENPNRKYTKKQIYLALIFFAVMGAIIIITPNTETQEVANPPTKTHNPITENEAHRLIYGFCYSTYAMSNCESIGMRLDTESIIESKVGYKFRERGNHHQSCKDGLQQAANDGKQNMCETAWEKYGCYGSEIPSLLQADPFTNKSGPKCSYN